MGAGGFGQEAVWVAEDMNEHLPAADRWDVRGYIDDDASKAGLRLYGYDTLGTPSKFRSCSEGQEIHYFCAIGDNRVREKVCAILSAWNWRPATLVHSSVVAAKGVRIGEGTYVGAGVVLCPNAQLGAHAILNVRAVVGHDVVIEDFAQLGSGATVNGDCLIERGAFLGSNASVHRGRSVGAFAVVGSNSQVLRSVKPSTTVFGVPAVVLQGLAT